MHDLYSLMYVSQASDLQAHDLEILEKECVARNARLNITGILLHGGHLFVQVLEGHKDDVQHVFAKIEKDRRHTMVIVLTEGPIGERRFAEWSMAFYALDHIGCTAVAKDIGWPEWPQTVGRATAQAQPPAILAAMQNLLAA